ncbi:MAG: hypothetical protein AUG04_07885, partial [Deltaproteobacteria bacterium 13_1_20CM_2_69_21]
MPPAATREPFARWSESSRRTALAIIAEREICDVNARFSELDSARGSWSWLDGPHARVRYDDLSQLVRCEAATLAPAPYLSRFERSGQVVEVRLERLDGGEAIALVHDVTSELRRQRDLQREREALMHEERMHAMGVLASGVAHDLNHALNVIALRVATLRADPQLVCTRRTLDVLARVVGEAARIVARLQDLARRRRDRPSDALDLAAVLTGALEMARTESEIADVRIEADVPPLPLVRGSAAELAHVFGSLLLHAREQMPGGGRVQVKARVDRGRVHEQDNLEVLREVLEMEDQRVESVRGGPDAIGLFERGERFDLVLCDVGMPQMSGWQVAREIQRIAPGTQIWMLTGWANEIGEADPRRRYVRGVLAKPLDLDQLRSLLTTSPG